MFKFITALTLVVVGIIGFFTFVNPHYKELQSLKEKAASYDEALTNSKSLENERDKLVAKFTTIDPDNLVKLQKMLPDNVDNIRLILEIEKIAAPYRMVLRDVKYSAEKKVSGGAVKSTVVAGPAAAPVNQNKDYDSWDLEFSVSGTYNDFINFTKDLESNLRIVDISSIQFSSTNESKSAVVAPEVYKYSYKIKTYWLKN